MGLSKPIIISTSAVDTSNLATKSDMTTLQNSVTSALSGVGGAVKKIQRGTFNCDDGSTVSITLSGFSDLSKMSVTINGTFMDGQGWMQQYYESSLTLTKLTIGHNSWSGGGGPGSYQVIQYK